MNMPMTAKIQRQCSLLVGCLILTGFSLTACSPALNWRKVALGGMTVMLPCKPDTAERGVTLAGSQFNMEMVGCEADGRLFAASHVQLTEPQNASAIQLDWQNQALQALGAHGFDTQDGTNPTWAHKSIKLRALGKSPEGKPLQAQLTWLVRSGHVYHLAVYGPSLDDAMTEPMTLEP